MSVALSVMCARVTRRQGWQGLLPEMQGGVMSQEEKMVEVEKDSLSVLSWRVYCARRARGLTQEELGDRALLNRKTITSVENNSSQPSFKVIVRIAMVLNLPAYLLFAPDEMWKEYATKNNFVLEDSYDRD